MSTQVFPVFDRFFLQQIRIFETDKMYSIFK